MREANSEAMKVGTFANRGLVLVTSTLAVYNMAGLAVPSCKFGSVENYFLLYGMCLLSLPSTLGSHDFCRHYSALSLLPPKNELCML